MKSDYEQKKLFEMIKKGKFNSTNCFEWIGSLDQDGYGITTFTPEKIKKTWKVHRLIYFLLIGEIAEDILVCHACDNPKCFNLNHLFLGTNKDNSQDREEKGRGRTQNQRGEKNHSATLNEVTVLQIRKMFADGTRICELVKIFNLNQPTVSKIVHRKRWIHI
jgi:HNH endonuclease